MQAARAWYASEEGGNATSVVRGSKGRSHKECGLCLRRTRFRGLAKPHLQHVAIAAAIHIDRIVAWLNECPRAETRTSRFAALAPMHDLPSESPSSEPLIHSSPDAFAWCRQRISIFYYKSCFCHIYSRKAYLGGTRLLREVDQQYPPVLWTGWSPCYNSGLGVEQPMLRIFVRLAPRP